ncbi:MAG: LLM class flavin-dependent oxidoreductase [Actinomycetales bacterium]|jgi:alkanesulfonate monooxygenase SsuD/methylene tetrahydromethanopterin reductase-like flavin-dependent oxidoreductase (luciferase family)|nr:LLM class flavin-dependent oxidoreductase [Actinomycetales bacterium]HMT34155.1 LLM class flavin-dependent oxidoreductase [Dermatophilaceae bacterium]
MKLALYLPNFRNHVTVQELADLTDLAEELDFDSVWTLDRVVVPEASDRGELQYSFGMMKEFPKQLPVAARGEWFQGWPLLPWLAARTKKLRIGMSITDTPYRSPGVFAAECATIDQLSGGRLNVGIGAGWMPEEFAAASATHLFPRRHAHVRETIEICKGIWTNETFEYHGEFADFEASGFGHRPVQKPHPPIYFSGLRDPKRSANRIAKYDLAGWIGIQDTPRELTEWRTAIAGELEALGRSVDDLDMCSMIWFTITDTEVDQSDNGKVSNILVGTAGQITDMLKRYKEAGLTMPLLWPPFADVPVSKTMDDLKRLKEEIMPKVEAS